MNGFGDGSSQLSVAVVGNWDLPLRAQQPAGAAAHAKTVGAAGEVRPVDLVAAEIHDRVKTERCEAFVKPAWVQRCLERLACGRHPSLQSPDTEVRPEVVPRNWREVVERDAAARWRRRDEPERRVDG